MFWLLWLVGDLPLHKNIFCERNVLSEWSDSLWESSNSSGLGLSQNNMLRHLKSLQAHEMFVQHLYRLKSRWQQNNPQQIIISLPTANRGEGSLPGRKQVWRISFTTWTHVSSAVCVCCAYNRHALLRSASLLYAQQTKTSYKHGILMAALTFTAIWIKCISRTVTWGCCKRKHDEKN